MNSLSRHIIERIILDVRTPTGGYALQQDLANWLRREAIPAIDQLCGEVLSAEARLHVDRIELDLGRLRVLDLNLPGVRADLLERLLSQLRTYLLEELSRRSWAGTQVQANTGNSQLFSTAGADNPTSDKPFAAWLFFLEHGHLPWWSGAFPPADEWSVVLADRLTAHARDRTRLQNLLRHSRNAVRRLVGDERHEVAFGQLLAAKKSLAAGWKSWRLAQGEYSKVRPQLPGTPLTTWKWRESGKTIFWWLALDETEGWTEAMVLAEAVRTLFPEPVARGRVGAMLGDEVVSNLAGPPSDPSRRTSLVPRSADDETHGSADDGVSDVDRPRESKSAGDDLPALKSSVLPPEDVADSQADTAPAAPQKTQHAQLTQNQDTLRDRLPGRDLGGLDTADRSSVADRENRTKFPLTLVESDSAAPETAPSGKNMWYVRWAGVVLAHPYLAPLFTALGYWQKGEFADEVTQQRAVYLTHYLASGQRIVGEEELALPKLLCGWPVSGSPALLTEPLTDPECFEADEVLRAVITHWSDSGMTSPNGLRGGFFDRDGRLEREENGWCVTVDRKAQDILLGRLPWGISVVYAPWHERMIKVEW